MAALGFAVKIPMSCSRHRRSPISNLGTNYNSENFARLKYAARALHREIFQFKFDYPLQTVPEAGPRDSLYYYLYSESLSWSIMCMGADGIPRVRGRLIGEVYKPAYIAWWGLCNLGRYLRHNDKASLRVFLNQVAWLESHGVTRADGAVVWPNPFDCLQGATLLRAPWVSAYDQGMAISALVRGYRVTRRPSLLHLLRGAGRIFELGCKPGRSPRSLELRRLLQ